MNGPIHGCFCNPQVKKLQQAHVCLPYLQLAMLHFQGGDWISIPLVCTEAVRDSMVIHVPINSILHICDCLRDRDFKQLSEDRGFRLALRDRCLCCGKSLTIGGPSVDHNLKIQDDYYFLQHYHSNDCEKTCGWCLTNIEHSAVDGDVSSHISERGVVRNLVTWLCLPLVQHGDRTSRRVGRSAWPHGPGLGSTKRPSPEEAPRQVAAAFKRQQVRRYEEADPHDGQLATRAGSSSHTEPVLLHPVS